MKNNYIRHAPYLGNSIAYDHDVWYTIVKYDIFRCLFHFFFKKLTFGGVLEVKGQKIAQNEK